MMSGSEVLTQCSRLSRGLPSQLPLEDNSEKGEEIDEAVGETYSQTFRQTATPPIRCVATNAIIHLYPCQFKRYIFRQSIKELTLYSCLPL